MDKKKRIGVKMKGQGQVVRKWKCPGCEITYIFLPDMFTAQGGAELCKDCLRENELLCRLGNIKKSPSES